MIGTLVAGAAGFVFDSKLGQAAIAAVAVVGLVMWFAYDQRAIGEARAEIKHERTNAQAVQNAAGARAGSADPNARGLRDPYTRAQ